MTTISELTVEIEGKEVGLSALLQKVDAQTQKAADSALKLQQQYARLAQAQGNTAGASSILSSALLNNGGASEQALVGVSTQLTKLQTGFQGAGSVAQQFGGALKSQLLGVIGPAAAATAAIGGLIAVGQSFRDAFNLKASLDATTASIKGQLEGVRDTGALFAEASAFGRQYNITQQETNAILSSATDILKTSSAGVGELETALLRLQTRDISKPISEASRALRELQAGDTTSIKELFNVPARDANRMKQEIMAGGDAVQVLTAYLDRAGVGMQALQQRTQGAAGTMLEVKKAQEDLALAQAQFSQGPGLALLQTQIAATTGATRLLSGDFATARQSITQFANEGSFGFQLFNAAVGGSLERIAFFQNAQNAANASVRQGTDIARQHAQAILVSADASDRAAQATAVNVNALTAEEQKKIDSAIATAALSERQAQLEADSRLAAQGLLGSGDQALALANKYGIAASAAQFLIQQQQALANKAALADQRAGERNPGRSGLAEQAAEEDRRLKALYRTLADPPKAPKRTGGGGGGAGATAYRQQLQDQAKYQNQSEDAEAQHLAKREQIYAQYAERVRKAQDDLQQSQLDTAASFYDSLGGISSGKIQQQASAEYEQTVQEAAAMGGEAGQKYLEAKEAVILARAKRQESIQKAQDGGDSAAAEYQRGVDAKYRQAEDAKLERIKAGGDAAANERDKALADEDSRYADSQEKIAVGAERSAERRALAHAKAGQAVDAEQAKLNALAATYDRLGPRAPAAAAAATTTTPAPAAPAEAGAPPDPVAAAVDGAREAIVAALAAIERATRETTGAVRGLKATGGVAG